MTAQNVIDDLQKLYDPKRAEHGQRFFKTGEGEYGENDEFLGLKVPDQRKVAKKYQKISLEEVAKLLDSPIHEHRFTGLVILVEKYKKANIKDKKEIYQFYLDHLHAVNNWDLVDTSAPYIVGDYLLEHHENRELLYKLAKSNDLWERRVSILATFAFIKNSDFKDALAISQILVDDSHDLIHKAVGWMLREIGKKDQSVEEKFLNKHAATMPRTMLRYAIEKFDEPQRQYYLGRRDSK